MASVAPISKHNDLAYRHIDVPHGLRASFYEISPAIARAILADRNHHNRAISIIKVEQLVSDIANGNFTLNGESIIFDALGQLLDGQHRLAACAESGVSIVSLVCMGIQPAAQLTVDQGRVRGPGDMLQLSGQKNGNHLAAVARSMIGYARSGGIGIGRVSSISTAEIMAYVDAHPEIDAVMRWAEAHRNDLTGLCSPSELSTARMILEPRYGEESVYYLDRLAKGDDIKATDPAFVVRKRMFAGGRQRRNVVLETILRGAVAHMENRQLTRIQLDGRFPTLPKVRA